MSEAQVLPSAGGLEEDQALRSEEGPWDHAIIGLDPEGRVARWSRGAGRLFGYEGAEIVGRPYVKLFRADGIAGVGVDHELVRAQAEGRAHWERWCVRRDGGTFWAGGTVVAMRDGAGGLGSYSVLIRDLTEWRRVEESLTGRARRSSWIADMAVALAEGSSLRNCLRGCAEMMVRHLDAAVARIWTFNDLEGVLELQASAGIDSELDGAQVRVAVGKGAIGRMAQDRRPYLTDAVLGDPEVLEQDLAVRQGLAAFAAHPLCVDDRLVGITAIYARKPLNEAILEALAAVEGVLARGIERKRSEEEQARLLILERQARVRAEAAEGRSRGLVEGLEAIVWEADPATRRFTFVSHRAEPLLGYPVAQWLAQPDFLLGLVHPDDRAMVLARRREASQAGQDHDLEYRVETADHRIVWLRDLGRVERDGLGRPIRLSGLLMETTRQKGAERRRATRTEVTQLLSQSGTPDEALAGVLRAVGEGMGWDLGSCWLVDPAEDVIRPRVFWHSAAAGPIAFEEASRACVFPRGVGFPGRVWAVGRPLGLADFSGDADLPRAPLAAERGLRGAFAFPIVFGGKVKGVVEFLSREYRPPDEDLLEMAATIGGQVGQFLEHLEAIRAVHESEARKAAILEAALDGIITIDRDGLIREFNLAAERIFGHPRAEAIGARMAGLIIPPALRERHLRGLEHYLATGEGPVIGKRIELPALRADGAEIPVEIAIVPISTAGPPMFTAYVRDLSERRRTEAALQESEAQVRLLLDSTAEAIYGLDRDGNCTFCNPSCLRMLGFDEPGGLLGRNMHALIHHTRPDGSVHPADECPILGSMLREEGVHVVDDVYWRRDGTSFPIEYRSYPVRQEGRVIGAVVTFNDISERKRAEEERKRAEGWLRFLDDASIVLAESLDYKTTLRRMAELAITSLADWCVVDMIEDDRSIRRLVVAHADPAMADLARALEHRAPPDPAGPAPMAKVLRTGRPEVVPEFTGAMLEALIPQDDLREVVLSLGLQSLMVVPISTGGQTLGAIALASTDGSRRRYGPGELALAEELARRAALAIENARLHRATQDACRVAEAASRAKDRFLAMLSHELRTPLTPVLLSASALLDDRELPDWIRPPLEMIRRNIELEASLIEDLLDITRIVQGRLNLKREVVDVHPLIRQALAICRVDVDAAGIRVELALDAAASHVDGDPARLRQVFWNLIKNAVKFTPAGGTLTLRTRDEPSPEPGGTPRLVVEVSDTGIGIAPEALPTIFDAFEQGGNPVKHRSGGLGLGLAISRSIIELHRGTLSAESAGKHQGATFTTRLGTVAVPLPDGNAPSRGDVEPSARQSLRLLFVEDNRDTAKVMARLLTRSGHAVTTAHDLASALEAARAQSFDMLISDLDLPDGDGRDLMRQLRRLQPVIGIALSGFGMEDDLRKSREAGFAEHMTKPIDYPRLEAGIERLARAGANRREGGPPPD